LTVISGQLPGNIHVVDVSKATPSHNAPLNVSVVLVLLAVALFVNSKVVELVTESTLVLTGIPVPETFISTEIALVLSIVTVASPLVVSQVLSVELGYGSVTKLHVGSVVESVTSVNAIIY
jgi:hypothetical protein